MAKYENIYDKSKDKTIEICLTCKEKKCRGECIKVKGARNDERRKSHEIH